MRSQATHLKMTFKDRPRNHQTQAEAVAYVSATKCTALIQVTFARHKTHQAKDAAGHSALVKSISCQ